MKKVSLVVLAAVLSVSVFGQSQAVEKFYNKYKDDRDAKVVNLNSSIFKLFSDIAELADDEDAATMGRIAGGIEFMNILALPLDKIGISMNEVDELRSDIKSEGYEELMTVRDGNERVYFMAKTGDSKIKNMLILVNDGRDELVLMNLDGILEMRDLAYLAENRGRWGK